MEECRMVKKYSHLTVEERIEIQMRLECRFSPSAIADGLNRPRSCIWRELMRNGWRKPPKVKSRGREARAGGYRAEQAHIRAIKLARKPRVERKMVPGSLVWEKVKDGFRKGLSPEQIAGIMARMGDPDRLSHETIYQAIYAMPKGELRAEMIELLRFGHKKRRPRSRGQDRRGCIPNMTSIEFRPAEVEERLVPGHWEGDLIKGNWNRSQVGTLVDRHTLYLVTVKLDSQSAQAVADAFSKVLLRFDKTLRRTLTYDRGKEMTNHEQLAAATDIKVYFAHPHSPWERGINENINGLLRQYLPKGEDLSAYSQDDLDEIAWRLNTRPRKSLGWKAPAELFLPQGSFDTIAYWREQLNVVALEP
jgi:IS30 family transposase